ncbi:MAG: Polysaccharide pyruvyl transferase [Firmicutes bacterium ADurb.Bin419]|nr:MAG: Polysaccharide pyruvyl transferase [Firmicutes bacterium ADurb.Bin419]
MKAGILTFHDANNYGAVLQAYGLQETIASFGIDTEIIDYVQPYIIGRYRPVRVDKTNIAAFLKSILSTALHYKNFTIKQKKFDLFRKEFLKISDSKYFKSDSIDGYEVYIAGSDQIWNFKITNYDDVFFLKFADGKARKISYAASIGHNNLNEKDLMFLKEHIDCFDYISVREASVIPLLNEMTQKELVNVFDPSLLLQRNEWNKINPNSFNNKNYIFVYSISASNKIDEVVNKVSKFYDSEVYVLTDKLTVDVKNHIRCRDIGPVEFIDLISNSKLVITDSFHGTAFSIIFEKNFISVPNEVGSSRIKDLLKLLNLESRVINEPEEIDGQYTFDIIYEMPRKILESERDKSINFLKNALNEHMSR